MRTQFGNKNINKQLIVCLLSFLALNSATAQFEEQTGISLPGVCESSVAWGDYNNDGLLDIIIGSEIYKNNGDGTFSKQEEITLPAVVSSGSSVAWGDYNNDGFLDILLAGWTYNSYYGSNISKIFKNNGNGTFTEQTEIILTGVNGSVAWGDYNNDGLLDILLTGTSDESPYYVSKIYKNNGDGTFTEQIGALLQTDLWISASWGDFNNDGYLDILLTGADLYKIYKNNSDGTFSEQTNILLTGLWGYSAAWGDYNNDSFLDILITGSTDTSFISKIYRNNGDGTFTEQTGISLTGVRNGSVSWGDYNNDGYLDILLTGSTDTSSISKIYKNNGNGTFTEQTGISLTGVSSSSVAWGDYNNDGKLDILLTGCADSTSVSKIYKNIGIYSKNTVPTSPTNLQQTVSSNTVTLKWDKASDSQTSQNGLSYNIRIGTSPGSSNIVAPMASVTDGFRRKPAFGNAGQKTNDYKVDGLLNGTYYWSVQAIDNAWAGGNWATESTFSITSVQASNISADNIKGNEMRLRWTNGNSDNCIVFMTEGNKEITMPANNNTFIANDTLGTGTQLDTSGWYCVYNGSENEVTVTSLKYGTYYKIIVFEYTGTSGNENYNTSISFGNPILARTKNLFEEQTDISLPGVHNSSVTWGDYNNDGFLDFVLTGKYDDYTYISKIYKNNGDGTFSEQTGTGLSEDADPATWEDYNNDGLLDIMIGSKIYKNNGDGTFSEQTEISLITLYNGSIAWGDYNNDGFSDIVICGDTYSGDFTYGTYKTKIYKNNGDGTFSEQTNISLTGVKKGAVAWGDYNNDGFLDLALTGSTGFSNYPYGFLPVSKIYKNNGDGTFTEQTGISLIGVSSSSAAWGDYNNDGFLDIVLAGDTGNGIVSKIYKNNGDGTFSEQTGTGLSEDAGPAIWADYNNDGLLDIMIGSKIYNNNGDGTFSEQTEISLMGVMGSATIGDYDNDGRLDILMSGYIYVSNNYGSASVIYKNYGVYPATHSPSANTPPAAPLNLQNNVDFNSVMLKWDKATDVQTPQNGLYYNIRMGSSPGGYNIVGPMASVTDGYRRIPAFGNAVQKSVGYPIKNLQPGTYYWSVQAIDNALAGGEWAGESSFTITAMQASNLAADSISFSHMRLSWTNGNSDKRIVFIAEGNKKIKALPVNDTSYTANSIFSLGTQIDTSGWYCIYNGNGTDVRVSGLIENTDYNIVVFEFTGSSGNETYNTLINNGNFITARTENIFEEQTGISLTGVSNSSAAWGDYNNDGFLDILLTGETNSKTLTSKIYKNNGDGTFTEQTGIFLTGVSQGSVAWGDYNNDGYLDILLTGYTGADNISKIYKNNGDGTFAEQTGISLMGLSYSAATWFDYNNDGRLDILLTGYTGYYYIAKIYRNDGNDTFTEQNAIELTEVEYLGKNYLTLGDYNQDGFTDILLIEYIGSYNSDSSPPPSNKCLLKNNGDGTFSKIYIPFDQNISASSAFADFNNDGFLDILDYSQTIYKSNGDGTFAHLYMGKSNDSGISSNLSDGVWGDYNNDGWLDVLINRNADKSLSFYKNNMNTGDEIFALQGVSLPQLTNGSIALGDLDNDGYLDILVTGESTLTDSSFSKIYRNIGVYQPNTTPDAPTNLQNTVNYSNITLKWDKGTDSQTPQNGLSYNIRIGTAPGGIDIVSPMASAVTGLRQKPDLGNAGQSTEVYTLTLPLGTYYWSVQAIDNAFAGGAWADENSFNVTSQQASNITVDSTSLYGLKLSWAKGNGDQRVVFVMEGDGKVAIPVNDTTYIPNNNFSSGTQIDLTGWYCVYNGTGNNVMITGLKEGTHYKVTVFEYSGTTGKENYNPGIGAGNVVLVETKQLFELQMGITLAFRHENYAWVDFNNDGWLDIFMTGCDVSGSFCGSVLYKNNGNGTFSEQTSFLGVGRDGGSIAWGDYNNDNYVDLMLSGYTGHGQGGWPTIVFKNNGDGTFTGPTYIDWNWSGSRWEDYNNDGRLDILLSHNSDGLSSAVYKNNGDGTFTKQTDSSSAGAKGIRRDYDNDGFRDIATGSHVFKNSDSITLSEQTDLVFSGKTEGPVVWGDYNNDGYLDKLIGDKVYKNNGAYLPEIRNMPPSAPTDLQYDIDLNSASLKWDKSTDAITPQDELSYNVRIGTNSGGFDIVSPAASIDNGKRWILEFGNAGQKNDGFLIKDLADGIYYWSVQAIDNDFAGGPWATEQTFSISKIGNSNFKFYPNPARDFITILQEEAQPCLITLIDFSGKIVLSRQINEKQENIQLYNLHKGFYILKLQTNNAVKTFKLVVK